MLKMYSDRGPAPKELFLKIEQPKGTGEVLTCNIVDREGKVQWYVFTLYESGLFSTFDGIPVEDLEAVGLIADIVSPKTGSKDPYALGRIAVKKA